MSASSGLLAKGEKGKSKFQTLDINNLYKSTEHEPTHQKGSLLRAKNGMQSLGKVPAARRPPANLPSLKSETSGHEPAVSLVPAGAAGWGSKPGDTPPPSSQTQNAPAAISGPPPPQPAPVAVVSPVVMAPPPHEQAMHNLMHGPDKSWSAIMAREHAPNFLAHQSPQFQHEFPKLASDGAPNAAGKPNDAQYGPGPSLRPQTEGSWIAGGGRPLSTGGVGQGPPGQEPGVVRNNLGPHPAVAQPMGPAGPVGPNPSMPLNFPHAGGYRPLQHPFIMPPPRPGFPGGPMPGMRPRFPFPPGRVPDNDELATRPIIRDEELSKMDEIARDPGWAANEDIDYNEKLAFSDGEEGESKKKDSRRDKNERARNKDEDKENRERDMERRSEERGQDKRGDWGRPRGYPSDEDRRKSRDLDDERHKLQLRDPEEDALRRKLLETEEDRRKVREEVAQACQVARQRKEDEVKRCDEAKRGRDWVEPKRETDRDLKREAEEKADDKRDGKYDRETKREIEPKRGNEKFDREGKRDDGKYDRRDDYGKRGDDQGKFERETKRDNDHGKYDRDGRDYRSGRMDYRPGQRSSQYNKMPPRFQAQADRMNSQRQTGSPQPVNNNFEPHWGHGRRFGGDNIEENRDRHTPDTFNDRYKGNRRDVHSYPEADNRRHVERKDRESDSDRLSEDSHKKVEASRPSKENRKEPSEERDVWRVDEDRRPQRPDSRDSRTSRDSRSSRDEKTEVRRSKIEEPVPKVPTPQPTPPRELKEVEEKKPPAPIKEDSAPAVSEVAQPDVKEEKEDKSASHEENRYKGRSNRGGRWGSAPTGSSTYYRPARRRVSSGTKPEQESGSSGEGGSELDKGEKDERNHETKRSTEPVTRDGFAPSGQPSRRGRGASRVRGGSSAPRRMDGYGPPPFKASFPQNEPAAVEEEEEEDSTKQKQAALNAGIVGGAAKVIPANETSLKSEKIVPPKAQRAQSQKEAGRGKPRGQRKSGSRVGTEGEEAWETVSNSDGEDRKNDSRQRRGGRGGSHRSANPRQAGLNRPVNAENKEDKVAEVKPKADDGDSSQTSLEGRPKKDFGRKESHKSGKPSESGGRSGTTARERDRVDRDRRNKPVSQTAPPAPPNPNPNPNGPQPLMSQVVNPPPHMKNFSSSTWRQTSPLPPRFQKSTDQRQQANGSSSSNDAQELNKITNSVFPSKNEQPRENAWDKPLGPRSVPPPSVEPPLVVDGGSTRSSPAAVPAAKLPSRDSLLDDAAPVNTIIFENTALKTAAPAAFTAGLKPSPVRVTKGNEWKTGDELFSKGPELVTPEPVADHGIKPATPVVAPPPPTLYHGEHGLDLLKSDLEMTEENAADLKHRLAGTKTLWDQNEDEGQGSTVFAFCQDNPIDGSGFGKAVESVVVPDDCAGLIHPSDVVYNQATQPYGITKHDPSNSSNVCKVKPQQQPVLSSGHSPLGHSVQSPLTPPPFSSTQGQFGYPQAGLAGSPAQFSGMPAIPSPPAGHPYSSQQIPPSSGLFTPFQMDRNQFGAAQFSTPYGLSPGISGTSSFNQAPLYLQHHATQSDMFSPFRVQHPTTHTNPNQVMMTSTTNSLLSASAKTTQNIGVIGSKGPFQQNNVFIPYDAMPLSLGQSYLSGSGIVQRSTTVQPAAPNFYSNSPAPQSGFFSNPNAGLGQPLPSIQQPFSRQGYVNQSTNLQNYSSPPQVHMDMGYRNAGAVGPGSYMKSGVGNVGNNAIGQPDVLNSVFNSAPPKTRPQKQMNQPPPQQSPTQGALNKFGNYPNASQLGGPQQQRMAGPQNMGLGGVRSVPRYPTPIQRPMAYRGNRPGGPHQHRPTGKPYYDTQDVKLDEGNDLNAGEPTQVNESKLSDVQAAGKADGAENSATPAE